MMNCWQILILLESTVSFWVCVRAPKIVTANKAKCNRCRRGMQIEKHIFDGRLCSCASLILWFFFHYFAIIMNTCVIIKYINTLANIIHTCFNCERQVYIRRRCCNVHSLTPGGSVNLPKQVCSLFKTLSSAHLMGSRLFLMSALMSSGHLSNGCGLWRQYT